MRKILVVYYSLEGNTKMIAKEIAGYLGADEEEIRPLKEIGTGFSKYFWGSSQVLMKKKPEIHSLQFNPENYDTIIIGTPVWAWTYAPPIATFLSKTNLKGKNVAFFSCHGGQNGKTFQNFKDETSESRIIGEIDFFEPLTKNKEDSLLRVKKWCDELLANL
ncbi:MAG: flavodoxin [Tindallia sp. MSAO_Bac2]|nr:MAG: flavodoxin [Tindallia sp. MSAO_Bac2]